MMEKNVNQNQRNFAAQELNIDANAVVSPTPKEGFATKLDNIYEKLPFYQSQYFWFVTAAVGFGLGWYLKGRHDKKK